MTKRIKDFLLIMCAILAVVLACSNSLAVYTQETSTSGSITLNYTAPTATAGSTATDPSNYSFKNTGFIRTGNLLSDDLDISTDIAFSGHTIVIDMTGTYDYATFAKLYGKTELSDINSLIYKKYIANNIVFYIGAYCSANVNGNTAKVSITLPSENPITQSSPSNIGVTITPNTKYMTLHMDKLADDWASADCDTAYVEGTFTLAINNNKVPSEVYTYRISIRLVPQNMPTPTPTATSTPTATPTPAPTETPAANIAAASGKLTAPATEKETETPKPTTAPEKTESDVDASPTDAKSDASASSQQSSDTSGASESSNSEIAASESQSGASTEAAQSGKGADSSSNSSSSSSESGSSSSESSSSSSESSDSSQA